MDPNQTVLQAISFTALGWQPYSAACHKTHITNFVSDLSKIVSGYDKEIPQSQTADKPMAPRGKATHQSQDTRKTN